jgi:hypothetical protein
MAAFMGTLYHTVYFSSVWPETDWNLGVGTLGYEKVTRVCNSPLWPSFPKEVATQLCIISVEEFQAFAFVETRVVQQPPVENANGDRDFLNEEWRP